MFCLNHQCNKLKVFFDNKELQCQCLCLPPFTKRFQWDGSNTTWVWRSSRYSQTRQLRPIRFNLYISNDFKLSFISHWSTATQLLTLYKARIRLWTNRRKQTSLNSRFNAIISRLSLFAHFFSLHFGIFSA